MPDFDVFGLFDYVNGDGDAYKYTSTEFTAFLAGLCGTGVSANLGNEIAATNNGLAVTVNTGAAYIKGRWGALSGAKTLNLTPTSAGYKRYDRIVARLHIANRKITLEVLSGTATTGSPTKPTLTQTDDVYELPLWVALVSNGSTVALEDERVKTYNAAQIIDQISSILSALSGKAASDHSHALTSDKITGVLPLSKGGLEATTPAAAVEKLGAMPVRSGEYADCNAMRATGLYVRTDWTNRPSGAMDDQGVLFVIAYSAGWGRQFFFTPHDFAVWERKYVDSVFSGWVEKTEGSGVNPIESGGTGATTVEGIVSNLGYASNMVIFSAAEPAVVNGKLWLKPISS